MFTGESNVISPIFQIIFFRNQLRFIWNRINSKPVITVTLRVDDKITLLPSVDDWMAAVRLHIFDLAPSIGLALQRAQHAHPNSLILNMVESKLFLTLQNDPEASGSRTSCAHARLMNWIYFEAQDVISEPRKVKNADQKDSEQN